MNTRQLLAILLLCFSFSISAQEEIYKEVTRYWRPFSRTINITSDAEKKIKITGDVKVEAENNDAWATLWLRVDNKNKEMGFFDNMGDRLIRTNEWKNYTIEGYISANAKAINFGGIVAYNGRFHFDNIKLYIEDEKGKMQEYKLPNSDFEEGVKLHYIPGWNKTNSKGEILKYTNFTMEGLKENENTSLLIIGSNIEGPQPETLGDPKSESPQISAMISMLEDLKNRVKYTVGGLKKQHVDHLHDEKANRIGALIMHLAAAEVYYQVSTFENRGFNEEEKEKWEIALDLGEKAREKFQGKEISYYLDIYDKVREKTIRLLKEKDDAWFMSVNEGSWGSNQYQWFHVMEHQSSHLGQILFLQKRLPPLEGEINLKEKVKN